jgi:hypothetical protein
MPFDVTTLRKILKGVAIAAVVLAVVAYLMDFGYFHIRMIHPKTADPLETFTAPRLLAIGEKGNKVDYEIDALNPEQTYTCAHSLFPQGGHQPCWYLKPQSQKPIPM